jgi:branched-chain amino acid transport system permease protein
MMDAPFVFGFTAAVIGGLDSPVGAVVGGLALGLVTSYVGGAPALGPSLEVMGAFVLLIVVLMLRPEGLFSGSKPRRV